MLKHSAARMVFACSAIVISIVACSSPDTGGGTGTVTSKSTSGGGGNGGGTGTGGSNGNGGGTGGGNTGGGNTGGGDTGGGATSDGGMAAAGSDSACSAMATGAACGSCCETNHAAGAKVMGDAYFGCLCGSSGACQTQCAKSDCSMDQNAPAPTPGDACDKCQQQNAPGDGTGKCDKQVDTACNADADCSALMKCYDSCPAK